jgi:hypothetical protein
MGMENKWYLTYTCKYSGLELWEMIKYFHNIQKEEYMMINRLQKTIFEVTKEI